MSLSATPRLTDHQENYFGIDDILATQERVPCKFEVPAPYLGYLDAGQESEHICAGAQMELPFWLAQSLCSRRRHVVSVELPKPYRLGYREILSADASVVDLHKLGPYFYTFGSLLLHFEHPECNDVSKALRQTFKHRLRQIMDSCQNALDADTSLLMATLDESERRVFISGQQALVDFMRWQTRQTEKLASSDMVANLKKRKRIQMEDTA